ncbi:sodium-coupled monocarboxylate transporter 1-like isoform X2 [Littorina saxatilis]|uniref:sodium-coupled monocarboxylate transporter 1-like isoform X2 n=1 Tax=Littorina saxatilis TaxID=31220 RepID=UPI0038B5CA46
MAARTTARGFHWADYLVFGSVLAISAAIGITAAIKHRKASAEQLLTGNRKLPLIPVALSLAASFMSAIFVLGIPAEAYVNSAEYWLIGLGYIPAQIITCLLVMPVIYKLKLTSGYKYLEYRFNRTIRVLGSLTFTLEMVLYMAVATYAPALALSQATKLSMDVSILATGLGGIKAVVWTDAFQMSVILAGFVTLIIRGTYMAGGWDVVMERARQGERFTWDLDLDPDPFVRHTFWTLFIGGGMMSLTVYAANQTMLQRYLSMRNIKLARWTIFLHLSISEFFLVLAMLSGLVMYAFFYGCDPLTLGTVSKADQLMLLFVMETLGDFPGLPGLFVACVYSAALSTVSSGVNSLAAVTVEDFLGPCIKKFTKGKDSDRFKTIVTIVSAIVYGLATIGLAYLAGVMGKTVLTIALSVFGMVGGPLLGLLLLGLFFPCVNSWGAGFGLVISLAVSLWTGIGAVVNPAKSTPSSLPHLNTRLCNVTANDVNATLSTLGVTFTNPLMNTSTVAPETDGSGLNHWYRLSYQHYATLSVIVAVFVGLIVSALTGFNKGRVLDDRTYYDVLGCCKQRVTKKASESTPKETATDNTGVSVDDVQTTRL